MTRPYTEQNKLMPYNGTCKACGEENVKMFKCGICGVAITRYCSPECQKFDWKSHKVTCEAIDIDNPR